MRMFSSLAAQVWHRSIFSRTSHHGIDLRTLFLQQGWRWLTLFCATLICGFIATRHGTQDLLFMVTIFAAAAVSSIAGFAFSAVCGAILFQLSDDHVQIVQIMIACSIANQATMTWMLRRAIDWRRLSVFLMGGLTGIIPGVWLLLHAGHGSYLRAIGFLLMIYGVYMLLRKPVVLRWQSAVIDFISGMAGGVTGAAAGVPSFPVSIWCSMKGWDKSRQRAVFQPFILFMQIAALAVICFAQSFANDQPSATGHSGFAMLNLLYVPGSLLGTAVGLRFFQRMTDLQFARAVNLLLIVSGIGFVI